MAKRKSRSSRNGSLSPIHPSLHFLLFLVLALILVVIVGYVMQKTAKDTRARFLCPQPVSEEDKVNLIKHLSQNCPVGVDYQVDQNGCGVWTCKNTPVASFKPLPLTKP